MIEAIGWFVVIGWVLNIIAVLFCLGYRYSHPVVPITKRDAFDLVCIAAIPYVFTLATLIIFKEDYK